MVEFGVVVVVEFVWRRSSSSSYFLSLLNNEHPELVDVYMEESEEEFKNVLFYV